MIEEKEMDGKKVLRNQKGFTLIEIIAVLMILAILAAVAIPKYLGMVQDAELASVQGVVAELNGRANVAFAKGLLDNEPGQYIGFVSTVGPDFTVAGCTDATSDTAPGTPATVTITVTRSGDTYTATWTAGTSETPGYFANAVSG